MAMAIRKAIDDIRHAGDSLRELGLGGSAVGTGINTHPDYRVKAVAQSGEDLRPETTPADRHALGHAVERVHGAGFIVAAQPCA